MGSIATSAYDAWKTKDQAALLKESIKFLNILLLHSKGGLDSADVIKLMEIRDYLRLLRNKHLK